MNEPIHVAVGVIQDANGKTLIARRPAHLHQGGLWEFPGGKVEPGEDVITALRRELQEELGITAMQTTPLISVNHDYGDRRVWLDVHRVTTFSGEPQGREGQAIQWVAPHDLIRFQFPDANRAILNAVRLPDRYMITGEYTDNVDCLATLEYAIDQGVRLIQFRANHLADEDYLSLARQITAYQRDDVDIMLNTSPAIFKQTAAAGLHLNSHRLMSLSQRPVAHDRLLSASVHSERELLQANKLGVDMLLVSPVLPTQSHPDARVLGWERLGELVSLANCPVYALGGLQLSDIGQAQAYGAQGIAAIRAMWCRH